MGSDENALWSDFDTITATEDSDVLARIISPIATLPILIEAARRVAETHEQLLSVRAHMGHGHAFLRLHQPPTDSALRILGTIRQQATALNIRGI